MTFFYNSRPNTSWLLLLPVLTCFLFLQPPELSAQEAEITEFLAINRDTLYDEDNESSDWIEIQNISGQELNLEGWFLTDDPAYLDKWRFPSVEISPGGFLVVFASSKNRAVEGSELHTNFKLSGSGEYLALVKPDGKTIVHEYSPIFPPQRADISYGLGQDVTLDSLISESMNCTFQVPSDGGEGLTWTLPGYDDSSWTAGSNTIGYDTAEGVNPDQLDMTNVAAEGTATQSSVCYNSPAGLAIDGSLDNFTHTCPDDQAPWWELDLGDSYYIDSIVIHNRTSCCGSRLRDITVTIIGDDGETTVFQSDLLNPENELGSYPEGPPELTLDLVELTGGLVTGTMVRIERSPDPDLSGTNGHGNVDEANVLSLGEIEIIGARADQPLGYNSLIATDVKDVMYNTNSTIYIRIPFQVDDPSAFEYLTLKTRYDDGFIAYLNGNEIARRNAPQNPAWNSTASSRHEGNNALQPEAIDLSGFINLLHTGDNLLAIHALNINPDDDKFLFIAELEGSSFLQSSASYFKTPTPGAPNNLSNITGFVADTTFSFHRGFYEEPFSVEITSSTPGSEIRYTTDGTLPTISSGTLYTEPVYIDKTTTLRAIAYKEGSNLEPTNVDTQTYIFLDDVILQDYNATIAAGFPASWGGTTPDYGLDPDVIGQNGEDRYGGKYSATIKDDLKAVPTMSIVMNINDMFGPNGIYTNSTHRGESWERAASVELIYPDGDAGFQENAAIRIQGGAFRSHNLTKKHSLRLLFKDEYGDTKLRYPLFGPNATDKFDTITLRSNSNDGWQWSAAGSQPLYIRDSFARKTMLAMDQPAAQGMFVHVYINGIYWGLYNPVERPDNSFAATYCGGEKETWDALTPDGAQNGNFNAWNTMVNLSASCATSDPVKAVQAFFRIQGKNPDGTNNPEWPDYLDVVNYADYMITNLYTGNTDWPQKNYRMGRDQSEDSTGFKCFLWDSEWTMGIRSDLNTNQVNASAGIAQPWSYLKQNKEFQLVVADRLHKDFEKGGPLYVDQDNPGWDPDHPERNVPAARFMELANTIDRAIVGESARWGDQHVGTPYTRDEHWEKERDNLLNNYFPYRSNVVFQQFKGAGLYPSTEAPYFNQDGGKIEAGFELYIGASEGTIYYTLDGTDPRLPGGDVSPSALEFSSADGIPLVSDGDDAKVFVPTNGDLELNWIKNDFDDSSWITGTTGVGFERSTTSTTSYADLIGIDLEDQLYNKSATFYMRMRFNVDDPSQFSSLNLLIKYDDGFAAYLNGQPVASRNTPAVLQWDSDATASHRDYDALKFEKIPIAGGPGLLRTGWNILAIHGLNSSASSSDCLILPRLDAVETSTVEGIVLNDTTHVKCRSLSGGEWSALTEADFRIPSPIEPLLITEIMYNPPDNGLTDGDEYEFVELQNTGTKTLDLSGVSLGGGIEFTFPQGTSISQGEFIVIASNPTAFEEKYPAAEPPAGAYNKKLSNTGDTITITDSSGKTVSSVSYNDLLPWPEEADGMGYSLVPKDPGSTIDPNLARYWIASTHLGGSPGEADSGSGPLGGWQLPGDFNQDEALDLSDAISLLRFMFGSNQGSLPCEGGTEPGGANIILLDMNGDDGLDLSDIIYLLSYLFNDGPKPFAGAGCIKIEGCPEICAQ